MPKLLMPNLIKQWKYSTNKLNMELLEKLKIANGELEILETYSGPDALGETQSSIDQYVRLNGFVNPSDYKNDLYTSFCDLFDEVTSLKAPKLELLKLIHQKINKLDSFKFFIEKEINKNGKPYFRHKYFKGTTNSFVEGEDPLMTDQHIQAYLEGAYEIYELTISRLLGLIKSIESIDDNNIVFFEKPSKQNILTKKVQVNISINNLSALFWALAKAKLIEKLDVYSDRFIVDNFENKKGESFTEGTVNTKSRSPDHLAMDFWQEHLKILASYLTK